MYTLLTCQNYLVVPIIFQGKQLGGELITMYRYCKLIYQHRKHAFFWKHMLGTEHTDLVY